ncbi:MAG: hypothetical protein Q8K61_01685 [Gallionella sp.]|nr:hypothetical protein [Gallionella sp.]
MPIVSMKKTLVTPEGQDQVAHSREVLLGQSSILQEQSDVSAPPVDNLTTWNHQNELKDQASTSDYFGSMAREDGFIARGIGHLIGHAHFDPDEQWRPFEDKTWKALSEGISEDLLPEFRKALGESTNASHADYLKGMVFEKMHDRELLSTMGSVGNAARFGYGLVSPESIALGLASGGVAKVAGTIRGGMTLARAGEAARVASKIEDPILRTEQMAKAAAAMEEAGRLASKPTAVSAGLSNAAIGGAAFEKMRQAVNFENDGDKVLESTLFSIGFAAPFVGLGVHRMNRLTRSAGIEREVLGFVQKVHKGETLTEQELSKIREYGYYVEHLKQEAAGEHHDGGYDFTQGMGEINRQHEMKTDWQERWAEREAPLQDSDGIRIGDEHSAPPVQPFERNGDSIKEADAHIDQPKVIDVVSGSDALLDPNAGGWASHLSDGVKNGTAKQVSPHAVLRSIHGRFEGTIYAPVIRALLKHPALNTRAFLAINNKDGGVSGLYSTKHDSVVVYVDSLKHLSDKKAQAFIHEMIHAHVNSALDGKLDHVLTPAQKAAVQGLKDLHQQVEQQLVARKGLSKKSTKGINYAHYAGDHYGLTDVKEFAAEAMTNMEFQKVLEGVKVGKITAMSALWEGIKKVLGVGKELDDSALRSALFHTEQLIGSRLHPEDAPSGVSFKYDGGEMGGSLGSLSHTIGNDRAVPTGPSVMGFAVIGGKKVPIRWDISQTLDNSPNPHIRQMGYDLVKNPIGWEGDKAQGVSMTERKERIRRVVAGEAHFIMREALDAAISAQSIGVVQRVRGRYVSEFYKDATRLARGDKSVLQDRADIAQHLTKAAGALRKFYDEMGRRAMESGLRGADNLPIGGNYVSRVYLHSEITRMADEHGADAILALFAAAFRNPRIRGDMKVSKEFVGAIQDLRFKTEIGSLMLHARDMGELHNVLKDHGLSDSRIESIKNVMFEDQTRGSDVGFAPNLKHRMDLDESASITLPTGKKLRMADLLENDGRLLIDKYTNSMGGYIAAAEHGWTDPMGDFDKKLRESDAWVSENSVGYDINKYNSDKTLAQNMFNVVVGRPMSTQAGGSIDRTMNAIRAWTRSVMLGELGIAAAFELKNAMAMSAYHGAVSQMPSFGKLIAMMRKGIPVDDQLAKDIQHMAGFGNEFAAQYARQHTITDHSYDRGLTRFENLADRAANLVDAVSGNATFTSATRNLAAKMTAQHLYDIAAGKKVLDAAFSERLIHNGISKESIKEVLSHLNEHAIADQKGVLQHIDWEGWQQANRKTYDDFTLALERFTRDGIQDHNIGETMPWMHTTSGKIIAELRTFNLVGYAKQFLKNVHYHDRTSAMIFMTGFVGESLAYVVQTSLNYAHDPDALAKRLSSDAIARAAVSRMSALGMMSYVIDTPFKYATGKPLLSGTNNTDNRDMFMTPSFMVMKRMVNGVQTAAQGMSPLSDAVTTKQEVKEALGVLPGINTYGVRNVVDFIAGHYPKSDPAQFHH